RIPHQDVRDLERRAGPGSQVIGAALDEPDDAPAHGAAAEQRDAHGFLLGFLLVLHGAASKGPRARGVKGSPAGSAIPPVHPPPARRRPRAAAVVSPYRPRPSPIRAIRDAAVSARGCSGAARSASPPPTGGYGGGPRSPRPAWARRSSGRPRTR